MEQTKTGNGPESPADLEWSQGAKNPREENDNSNDDKIDMLTLGTLFSDTEDDKDDDIPLILKDDTETLKDAIVQKPSTAGKASGTPSGDTVAKSNDRKKKRPNDKERTKNRNVKRHKSSDKPSTFNPLTKLKIDEKAQLIQSKHVYVKLYADFLEYLNNRETDEKAPGYKPLEWYENCVKKKTLVYEALRKDSLSAVFCQTDKDGSMSRTQARFVQEYIMDCLVEYYQPYRRDVVKFEDCTYENGYFRVMCADKFSLLFLKSLSLENVWPECPKVRVITNYDLCDMLEVTTILPIDRFKDFNDFLKLIVFQNREIDVRRWILMKKEVSGNSDVLYLKMDRTSVQDIMSVGGKLYCGVEYITFYSSELKP